MASDPRVSVVVPVYNDPAGLAATLSALTDQTYPADRYEVLPVDNGSTDDTPAVIRSFAREHSVIRPAEERERQGSYAARNRGIELARGEILAFVDADVTVERTWLARVVDRIDDGHDYVGCAVEVVGGDGTVAAFNRQTEFPVGEYMASADFAPTCGLVVRRAVIDAVGPFDADLLSSGDKEFGDRVSAAGFDQHYAADVPVYHPARSARELLSKYVRIGRGFEQVDRRYPDRFDHGPLVDPTGWLPALSPSRLSDSAAEAQSSAETDLSLWDLAAFFVLQRAVDAATVWGRASERLRGRFGSDGDGPSRTNRDGSRDRRTSGPA